MVLLHWRHVVPYPCFFNDWKDRYQARGLLLHGGECGRSTRGQ